MPSRLLAARGLATAFLAGPWQVTGLIARGTKAVRKRLKWLDTLAERISKRYPALHRPTLRKLIDFINSDVGFFQAWKRGRLTGISLLATPHFALGRWNLPVIETVAQLADWLEISASELEWFADCYWSEAKSPIWTIFHHMKQLTAFELGTRSKASPYPIQIGRWCSRLT